MRKAAASFAAGLLAFAAVASARAAEPKPGDKAPAFTLKAVDKGDARSLASLVKGKSTSGAVIVFLSCKCPYVKEAHGPIAELVRQYGGKVQFVGLNANQNESEIDIRSDAAASFAFPVLRDDGSKVADLYAASRTPEAFLVDATGVIRYHGGVADLGAALAEFTVGKPISKPDAKSFGCTIKRKP